MHSCPHVCYIALPFSICQASFSHRHSSFYLLAFKAFEQKRNDNAHEVHLLWMQLVPYRKPAGN